MRSSFSFVTKLNNGDAKRRFATKVNDGETTEKTGGESRKPLQCQSRRHTIRRCFSCYDWTPGERVVLVSLTGAGVVPTALFGTFLGFTAPPQRRAAIVLWDESSLRLPSTVAVQRIRPVAFIPK